MPGASDDELTGVIGPWDRARAQASARRPAAVARLIRRHLAAYPTEPTRYPI